ncbi:MAG: BatA and WFA domain-containing protein [Deltaproteobacteria bacterium]|nr:BatA and WFA domain-containing protein [Deltaproteobacteria bacterium]
MEFSHPTLLWALPAVSLPLLIHLINRHRARRRPFAAIDFLLRVQRKSARRILLKQLLLLLLRTLLLLTLILAASGPRWSSQIEQARQGPRAQALVIDASLSMRTQTASGSLFSKALQRAKQLARQMEEGDSICLLRADQTNAALLDHCSDSTARLLRALEALEAEGPSWARCDLFLAAEHAASLLAKDPRPNKRIILLSDGAAHAFGQNSVHWPDSTGPIELRLEALQGPETQRNHAVSSTKVSSTGPQIEISAQFFYFGPEAVEQSVEMELDGEIVTRGLVNLKPGQSNSKRLSLPMQGGRDRICLIKLPEDALAEDDHRRIFLRGRATLKVLLVNGDMRPILHRDELFYLEQALAPASRGGPGGAIHFASVTPERLNSKTLTDMQVLVLANVRQLAPENAEALRRFVTGGGGLLLALGDRVDVEQGNAMLGDLLAWPLRDVVALGPLEADGSPKKGLAFDPAHAKHPVLSAFGPRPDKALMGVRTRRAFVLEPGSTSDERRVLIRFANGLPALVERRLGLGRVLLFTSSLDRDWTNWPARASFLPFLQHAIAYLSGQLQVSDALEVEAGQTIQIPLPPAADKLLLDCPHGQFSLNRKQGPDQKRVLFEQAQKPGWCAIRLERKGRAMAPQGPPGLMINPPSAESDPRPMNAAGLRQGLGKAQSSIVSGMTGTATHSLALALLVLALLLVLAESLLIRR